MFRSGKSIGDSLVQRGILTPEQAEAVLQHCEATGLPFTQAGIELGHLKNDRASSLRRGHADFFQLNTTYFPQDTRDLLTQEAILKYGALPLGTKAAYGLVRAKVVVNVGFLDPRRKESIRSVEAMVSEQLGAKLKSIRPFFLLPDQFLSVLESAYGVQASSIARLELSRVDPSLGEYVRSLHPKAPTPVAPS